MNILFATLWNYNDALSITTVLPHLEILSRFPEISKILLVTGEQNGFDGKLREPLPPKTEHIPFIPAKGGIPGLNRLMAMFDFADHCANLARKNQVALMMFRGSTAGSGGYLAWRKTGIPYTVESYEPHAAYMLECGVWSRWGPKYILQEFWERQQKKTASFLIPCAQNYARVLQAEEGVPSERIKVIPCCVPMKRFFFSDDVRKKLRSELNIPQEAVVGIYLGKFGGLYYAYESFLLFAEAFRQFGPDYFQIILTPNDPQDLLAMIRKAGLPENRFVIRFVENKQVPAYLSAADFAYSPIVFSPSQKHRSLIKNGEYWACGLPILQTDEVGDDYLFIEKEQAGANFRIDSDDSIREAFGKIKTILQDHGHRTRIAQLAERERNFSIAEQVYREILSNFYSKK